MALAAVVAVALAGSSFGADSPGASLKAGNPNIKSAGPLAFGPDGILFVGDTTGAAIFAIDTGDRTPATKAPINIKDVDKMVAARLGTDADKILINDVVVNPISGKAYLAVSRGRGPDATPVILRVGADGKLDELALENVKFAKADVPNAPAAGPATKGQTARSQSITDLAYLDGRVFIAGLSNEEWTSRLMVLPFPFSGQADGAGIQIYHGAHGRLETQAPVRTFVTYAINSEPYLLAAYQYTPLVKVPVADLKAGAHVKGTTIAELGNGNRPLDMIVYQKGGKDYLLLSNSARGVMKIPTEGAGSAPGIDAPVAGTKGMGYDTIASLKGVLQLDQLDKTHALLLVQADGGTLNLETVELP
jgi:hypothetical protein